MNSRSLLQRPFYRKIIFFLKQYPPLLVFFIETFQFIDEKYEYEVFEKLVKKNMVILDIGANIGMYALRAAKLLAGTGKVYAFEPEIYNNHILEHRVKQQKIGNVITERLALSDKEGNIKLFLDSTSPTCHSFSRKNLVYGSNYQLVKTTRLDKYLESNKVKKVDIIVIDVQGAESKVFAGAKNLLKKGNTIIIMEYWPSGISSLGDDPFKLIKKLAGYGYKIKVIDQAKKRLISVSPTRLCEESQKWVDTPRYADLLLTKVNK